MNVALYIYDNDVLKRLDTFKDETIQVTSSIQNINDISKIFTDYSQSFTIPASDINNAIFTHWYDGLIDGGYNANVRYKGFIEIDTEIFRIGLWQLESAEVEDNKPKNYKLTFYGVLRSLQDQFGEDKLKDLEGLQDLSFEYTAANVRNRVQVENDIIFPLISSRRVWQYGSGSGVENISTNGHGIVFTELFPAVRVSKIFEAIENKYNINFSGVLLNQTRFTKLFCWFKNSDFLNITSSIADVDITSSFNQQILNTTGNFYNHQPLVGGDFFRRLFISVTVPATTTYSIFVFKNNVLFTTLTFTDSITDELIINQTAFNQNSTFAGTYTFKIQTSVPLASITIGFTNKFRLVSTGGVEIIITAVATATTTAFVPVPTLAPDIKVSDFFSGILKMFNLTAISFDEVNYQLEQLEDWYLQGGIKDITEYTTTDITIDRVKIFKNINFKYQKGQSFVNQNYRDSFNKDYGDLVQPFTNDGQDYNVTLPFEKLQYVRLGAPPGVLNGSLNVAYSLQAPDFKPYVPKPVLFYLWENRNMPSIWISGTQLTNYLVTGDFTQFNFQFHSNNFGQEQSIQTGGQLTNSLFSNYYSNYITNIFKEQNRIYKVKDILPTIDLVRLKLNDRLIIRDTRFIINEFTTNLITGVVDFSLIKDFRDALSIIQQTNFVPSGGGLLEIPIIDKDEIFTIKSDDDSIIDYIDLKLFVLDVSVFANVGTDDLFAVITGDKGSIINIILQAP
jgi:hypothetical protein